MEMLFFADASPFDFIKLHAMGVGASVAIAAALAWLFASEAGK